MFHISFLVRDKHLADTLRALENRALNLEVKPAKVSAADSGGEEVARPTPRKRPDVHAIVHSWIDAGAPFTVAEICAHDNVSESAIAKVLTIALDKGETIRYKKGKGFIYVRPNLKISDELLPKEAVA